MSGIKINKYVAYGIILAVGLILGWLLFRPPGSAGGPPEKGGAVKKDSVQDTVWTCSMHPQIRRDKPGKCPICGMDLIPLVKQKAPQKSGAVVLPEDESRLAGVQTTVVSKGSPVAEVRLYGKVQADERQRQSLVSNVSGRIDKLFVNFTGEAVQKGQPIAEIYSPELVTAQQELLEAAALKAGQPAVYQAARDRLRQWKLTENQISGIETSGRLQTNMDVYSGNTGIVLSKRVNTGDYVSAGGVLFEVADLSKVWVLFDAYESDLPYLKKGDAVDFTLQALPGEAFRSTITFIDPVIDPLTRVARVRVEINNSGGKLKPEMFATGIVKAPLNTYGDNLVIPRSAVLWTGKRSIVYVKEAGGAQPGFVLREVELGPLLGNSYVIESGLSEGEVIVTQGAFSIDATAQLEGKPSMMNH